MWLGVDRLQSKSQFSNFRHVTYKLTHGVDFIKFLADEKRYIADEKRYSVALGVVLVVRGNGGN